MRVVRGPEENRARPAIDPLFRSAAVAYQSRVIGMVLTGFLNDGTAGLLAIKRCGGIAIVQEPEEVAAKEMPQQTLDTAEVGYRLPISPDGSGSGSPGSRAGRRGQSDSRRSRAGNALCQR